MHAISAAIYTRARAPKNIVFELVYAANEACQLLLQQQLAYRPIDQPREVTTGPSVRNVVYTRRATRQPAVVRTSSSSYNPHIE